MDHSSISWYSHLLVMIAAIYDPAFYFTSEEVGNSMDIPTIVEESEVHILGVWLVWSWTSLFNEHSLDQIWNACKICVCTNRCMMLFGIFHGDNPAQRYETGNKIVGNYPCTMCHSHVSQFDDLAFYFKADNVSLTERWALLLSGCMWKEQRQTPLEKLTVVQLREELAFRGIEVKGKLKPDLANYAKIYPIFLHSCNPVLTPH